MSFGETYPNRKDHRCQYRGAKSFDRSCRNHGSCPYCKRSRKYQYLKEIERVEFELGYYIKRLKCECGRDVKDCIKPFCVE